MNSLSAQKAALRSKVLKNRLELSDKEWEERSSLIINKLLQSDVIQEAATIHTYLSINQRKEVCTDQLIARLFDLGKRVVVPLSNFEDHTLTHAVIEPDTEFVTNKWGVREPVDFTRADAGELDVVIVPMAAGDEKGNRLGYGKGFYDRFLAQTEAEKIGLLFDDFILSEIPVEDFDEKLDRIISEEREIFA